MPTYANYTPKCNKWTKENITDEDLSEFQRDSMHPEPTTPIFNGRNQRQFQYDNITCDLKERRGRKLNNTQRHQKSQRRRPDHNVTKETAEPPAKKQRHTGCGPATLKTAKNFRNTKENVPGLLKRFKKTKKIEKSSTTVLKNVTQTTRPYDEIFDKGDLPSTSGINKHVHEPVKKPLTNKPASPCSNDNFAIFGEPLKTSPSVSHKKKKKTVVQEKEQVERSELSRIREIMKQQKVEQKLNKEEIEDKVEVEPSHLAGDSQEVFIIPSSEDEVVIISSDEEDESEECDMQEDEPSTMPSIQYDDLSDDEDTYQTNPIDGGTIPDSQERTPTDDELDEF